MNYSNVKALVGLIFLTLILNPNLKAQDCDLQKKLLASDPQSVEFLGGYNGVDISGNYAIVGAQGNNENGALAGAAHFFKKEGSEWVNDQKVVPTDVSPNDRFGRSVAIWGDYAIVGSPFDDINGFFSGSAFIYHRIGQSWIQEYKITPEDGEASDRFGWEVDIWEDYIIVGTLNDYTPAQASTGSAYIFKRDGEIWNQVSKLSPETGCSFDEYGSALSIKDNLALVGAHFNDTLGVNSGAAYLYANQDTAWVLQQTFVASDGSATAQYGISVSVSEGLATIGAHQDVLDNDTTGAVYVYRNVDGVWEEEAKLVTPETTTNIAFGISNDHLDDRIVIGTTNANSEFAAQTGAVFVFDHDGTDWVYERKINANDAQNVDFFGVSVAMDGDFIIAGAPGEDTNGGDAGAAYIHYAECQPVCTTISTPLDGGFNVPVDTDIEWYPVEGAEGYLLSMGTTSGATDILDNLDVGIITTYDLPMDLITEMNYYVNIVPYNVAGSSSGCIESTFSTSEVMLSLTVGPDVDVPCYEPIPNEDYIVNNLCADVTVEVTSVITEGDCPAEYSIERTYVATDGCSTQTDVQIINVVDNDPPTVLTVPSDTILLCGQTLPTELATGEDQCQDTPITVTYEDSPAPECGQVITRTFFLTDDCGNFSTATQTITIGENMGLPECSPLESPIGGDNPLDVTLTWTETTDVLGYVIYVGLVSDGSLIVDSLDVGNVLTYDLNGLDLGTEYFVQIFPYNGIGAAVFCTNYFFSTGDVPTCIELTEPSGEILVFPVDIDLVWSLSPEASGYFLSVGTTSGGTEILDNLDVMNVTSYNFPTLVPETVHYVTIVPYNDFGVSESCEEFSFETDIFIGLDELDLQNQISVYPNPNEGNSISINLSEQIVAEDFNQVILYDALGKRMDQKSLVGQSGTINWSFESTLAPGVYSLIFQSENGQVRKSVIVN